MRRWHTFFGATSLCLALVSVAVVGIGAVAEDASAKTSLPTGTRVPGAANCPMFPANNVWNTSITNLPVDRHSAAWLASMSSSTTFLHPDFGPSGDPTVPYGIPFIIVSPRHPLVHITFQYASESDRGPYPFG